MQSPNNRVPVLRILGVFVLGVLVVACGTAPAPAPAPVEPEATGTVEPPPSGGEIILDPNGWSMGGNALADDQTNTMAIPNGFTGGLSEISFVAGPNRTGELVPSVTLAFASGASMQVATGTPNWQCKASGAASYSDCTTLDGNSIGSAWAPSGASITVGSNPAVILGPGVSITFK